MSCNRLPAAPSSGLLAYVASHRRSSVPSSPSSHHACGDTLAAAYGQFSERSRSARAALPHFKGTLRAPITTHGWCMYAKTQRCCPTRRCTARAAYKRCTGTCGRVIVHQLLHSNVSRVVSYHATLCQNLPVSYSSYTHPRSACSTVQRPVERLLIAPHLSSSEHFMARMLHGLNTSWSRRTASDATSGQRRISYNKGVQGGPIVKPITRKSAGCTAANASHLPVACR
jgi:hypothetical protein